MDRFPKEGSRNLCAECCILGIILDFAQYAKRWTNQIFEHDHIGEIAFDQKYK
jgi:hypothetical protein